ncbi:hypothetical protein ACJJIF_00180 (plasmid) [Microbulbifer sp. SSSA002]|uniref:hypothetical protein n=1 Tax=Microbulbifer sp. SSSA002 TaxID=3243376 RepID=UPI004039E68E
MSNSYFNQLGTASLGCFRIYRETLSRFSCAASVATDGSGRLAIDEDSMQALYCERWSVADVQDHKVPERLIDLVSTAAFWLAEGTHSVLQNTSAKALTAAS